MGTISSKLQGMLHFKLPVKWTLFEQPETWFDLKQRLRDGGRIMINCGGICVERSDSQSTLEDGTWTWEDGGCAKDATLRAMLKAFPGQTLYRILGSKSDNYMALTGPPPDFTTWATALPERLRTGLSDWRSLSFKNTVMDV